MPNEKSGRKRRKIYIPVLIFAVISVFCVVSLLLSKYALRVTEYAIDKGFDRSDMRIVHLSDLHSAIFGDGNCRLIDRVKELSPDIICMTGDTVSSSDDNDFHDAASLVKKLSQIAPVYISLGNHETDLGKERLDLYVLCVEDAGGKVLEKEYIDTEINGVPVRIGGTSGYALSVPFWEASYGKDADEECDDESFSEQRFMLDFEKTSSYKILLLHRPEAATLFWADKGWYDVDLVLSGHTHGGQVRLPFIGGLRAPEEGYFPKFEYGHFVKNGVDVIVSAGLGTGNGFPRFNNIPEIVSVTVD